MKQKFLVCIFICLFLFINGQAQDSIQHYKWEAEVGIGFLYKNPSYSNQNTDRLFKSTSIGLNYNFKLKKWKAFTAETGIRLTQNYRKNEFTWGHNNGRHYYSSKIIEFNLEIPFFLYYKSIINSSKFQLLPTAGIIFDKNIASFEKVISNSSDPDEDGSTDFNLMHFFPEVWRYSILRFSGGGLLRYKLTPFTHIELHIAVLYTFLNCTNGGGDCSKLSRGFHPFAGLRLTYGL